MKLYLAINKYIFTENDNGNVKNDIQAVGMAALKIPKRKFKPRGYSVMKNNKKVLEEFIKCKKAKKLKNQSTKICQENYFKSLSQG